MDKQKELDDLALEMTQNQVGHELASQATQLVFGAGNPDAEVVFVGEAPGKKEDETGRPFVGASGRFLDKMLEAADLERDDVYITNIVKYRPPNNRDPSTSEKSEFLPYLIRQLEIIKPRAVLTLGRHSGAVFLPDLVISRDHGQPHGVKIGDSHLLVVPLYHPAAALYNGGMRQVLIDDFLRAVELARGD